VVAVLLYHAGLSFVPGGYVGVDVFFVISGCLITGLLLREVERAGKLSIMRFYSRQAPAPQDGGRTWNHHLVVVVAVLAGSRQDCIGRQKGTEDPGSVKWPQRLPTG
jgi:hypothetical protein